MSPAVVVPFVAGFVLLALFVLYEAHASEPMLPLRLFRRRNFSAGNVETLAMYAGLAILFFFLILFMQQIGSYSPLKSGLAILPATVVMFFLSRRFGALADRFGPRFFMGAGPLVAAAGLLLFQTTGAKLDYMTEVLPALLIFSVGLSMTVAPLTAAVLQGAEGEAGIASGVNNAVARVAGLIAIAAVGVLAKRSNIPPAILLVLTGVVLALVPGLPAVRLPPELVLLLVLPPLIYSSAVAMSWREFHFNLRPISLLAIGGVVTQWFVAPASPQFGVVQGVISLAIFVAIVFVLALWPKRNN